MEKDTASLLNKKQYYVFRKPEEKLIRSNFDQDLSSVDSTKCRVCLKAGKIPIFGSANTENISEPLCAIGAIEISECDDLPKYLCLMCYNLLQNAMLLRNKARDTDKILQSRACLNVDVPDRAIKDEHNENELIDHDCTDSLNTNKLHRKIKDISDKLPINKSERKLKVYHCDRCSIDFSNWKAFTVHKRSQEHIYYKVQCSVCKKMYLSTYIKKHILRHRLDPLQAIVCDVCGKSFVVLEAFKRHKSIHGFEFPFKCHLCPYKGRFNALLKMHMRTHTGEKPYSCTQCPARFVDKSNLNKHASTHKLDRDFKCDGCGKAYFRKGDLKMHIKVDHWGVKEHVCDICGKEFGYRKRMMKHKLKVHKRDKLKSGGVPSYIRAEQYNILQH